MYIADMATICRHPPATREDVRLLIKHQNSITGSVRGRGDTHQSKQNGDFIQSTRNTADFLGRRPFQTGGRPRQRGLVEAGPVDYRRETVIHSIIEQNYGNEVIGWDRGQNSQTEISLGRDVDMAIEFVSAVFVRGKQTQRG